MTVVLSPNLSALPKVKVPLFSVKLRSCKHCFINEWTLIKDDYVMYISQLMFFSWLKNKIPSKVKLLVFTDVRTSALYLMGFHTTVEVGDKKLFGHPKIVSYPYEVNWQLVTGNGSLTPICSKPKLSLSSSLTINWLYNKSVVID